MSSHVNSAASKSAVAALRQSRTQAGPSADERAVAVARDAVAAAFSSNGASDANLASAIDGYVPRDSQRQFALEVFDAIAERGTLVAEAGTGTGKTMAYLVPALIAGGKVLVSTATKALQDQVFHKDLATAQRALGLNLRLALLKGRQNYLCLHRMARTEQEGLLASRQDVAHLRSVVRFAQRTFTGDRAELSEVPENATIWPAVTSTRENCLGAQCPRYDDCFVYKARREAMAADVVVVNHHLFLADLALRDDVMREFLPTVDTVVLDEAHQLPKLASDFFGELWSLAQCNDLAHDARALGLQKAIGGADWVGLSHAIEHSARQLRLCLSNAGFSAGARIAIDQVEQAEAVAQQISNVGDTLAALAKAVQANSGRDAEFDALQPRVDALLQQVQQWASFIRNPQAPADDDGSDENDAENDAFVRWIGITAHGAQFHATPLSPANAFARARAREGVERQQAWILCSATLTVAKQFHSFLNEIGLPQARTGRWESPFDFAQQALLYLPQTMPNPLAYDFPERVADAAWPIIKASGGRCFMLCTTLRAVERVAQRLRERMHDDDIELSLLVQGTSTRRTLLDEFRRSGNGVLVGSVSFWEGIDVRGEALSLVVIDKLPFAPPDDPVVRARIAQLKAAGRNAFMEFQLPQAVTLLKQGVGRLIRDEHDRGVLMILDERLLTKSYGKTVIASLPPFARTREEENARAFFQGNR